MRIKETQEQKSDYIKDLSKDIALFTAGLFTGPFIDAAQLVKKHAPVIHREIKRTMRKKGLI